MLGQCNILPSRVRVGRREKPPVLRPPGGHPAQVTVTVTVSDHRIVTRRRDRDYAVKSTGTIRNRYQKSQSEFQATTRTHDPIRVLRIIMSLIF